MGRWQRDDVAAMRMKAETMENVEVDDKLSRVFLGHK